MNVAQEQQSEALAKRAHLTLAILTLVNVVNWMDRSIVAILLDPIKREFQVSDTAMGLLNGLVFSLVYAVAALPIARFADRASRRNIVAAGLTVWSAMTALCGLAQTFPQILLARMGVGAGEAAGAAPSHSMISDLYPRERRAWALGIHTSAIYVGTTLSALVGGFIGHTYGWRAALVVVSLPGLILAILLVLLTKEPPRSQSATKLVTPPLGISLKTLLGNPVFVLNVVAMGAFAIVNGAMLTWTPAFLGRVHQLNLAEIGLTLATVKGATGIAGVVLGGVIASRYAAGGVAFQLRFCALVTLAAIPALLGFTLISNVALSLVAVATFQVLITMPLGIGFAVVQDLAPPTMRAFAAATCTLVTTLIGVGGGPVIVGVLNDAFTPVYGPLAVRYGLTALAGVMLVGTALYAAAAVKAKRLPNA